MSGQSKESRKRPWLAALLGTLAPLLAVGIASIADAYVIARLHQQETHGRAESATPANPAAERTGAVAASSGVETHTAAESPPECPECGEELDPDLDFCPWCTTRLPGDAGE